MLLSTNYQICDLRKTPIQSVLSTVAFTYHPPPLLFMVTSGFRLETLEKHHLALSKGKQTQPSSPYRLINTKYLIFLVLYLKSLCFESGQF